MIFLFFWPPPLQVLSWAMIALFILLMSAVVMGNKWLMHISMMILTVLSVINLLMLLWYWYRKR